VWRVAESDRVELKRSGGFANVTKHAEIDATELSGAERAGVDALLRREASGQGAPHGRPDEFQYDITVVQGAERHHVRLFESELDEELRPLVQRLVTEGPNG
jgi:hypothetical protein